MGMRPYDPVGVAQVRDVRHDTVSRLFGQAPDAGLPMVAADVQAQNVAGLHRAAIAGGATRKTAGGTGRRKDPV
jgi:hypothetical protein